MLKSSFNLATLLALAAMGASAQASAPAAGRRGQPGLKNIVGPATNWPSGKIHKRRSHYPDGQCAKFPKARKHKQHVHPLRGDNGAYTLVGAKQSEPFPSHVAQHSEGNTFRRIWLAGISAQRGY